MPNQNTPQQPTYIIDALNLCRYNKNKPSLDALLTLLLDFLLKGIPFFCMFDANTQYQLPEEQRPRYRAFIDEFPEFFSEITGRIQADPFILLKADKEGCEIVTNDQYREHQEDYPWLKSGDRLIKWNVAGGSVQVVHFGIHIPIQRDIESAAWELAMLLRKPQAQFQKEKPLNDKPELTPNDTGFSEKARLIVFALDASGSMWNPADGADKTYDGRLKSDHLNEVLRGAIKRFGTSMARDSFYSSVINFAGNSSVRTMGGKSMLNITEAITHIADEKFNYLQGVSGNGTNIAEALRAGKQLIDSTLELPHNLKLHSEWHALIILITDGRHTGDLEGVKKLARQAAISNSTLQSGNIRIAAVGIGSDCDAALLSEIAAEADPTQLKLFKAAKLDDYLQGKKLVVVVSEKTPRYAEAIRKFVDIVTETVA